jgi:hypothetical protein
MLRNTLILCAAILAVVSVGCAITPPLIGQAPIPIVSAPPVIMPPVVPIPVGTPPPPPAIPGLTSCDGSDTFQGKILYTVVSNFVSYPGAPLPPASSFPSGTTYVDDLVRAYCAASPDFQSELLKLDVVFVNGASCGSSPGCLAQSWGWWQSKPAQSQPSNPNPSGRVIALATGLWGEKTYSNYESDVSQSVLPPNLVTYGNVQSCSPFGVCQQVDTLTTTLLAAMAHEVGHIAWYVLVRANAPTDFCGGNFFRSWVPATVQAPPPWRDLLTPGARDRIRSKNGNKWPYIHARPPQIDAIDHPGKGDPPIDKSIFLLVADSKPGVPGAPWASPFAAMSPDEDFVETYKLKVLTTAKAPITSAEVTVANAGTANIVRDLQSGGRPVLNDKLGCIPINF